MKTCAMLIRALVSVLLLIFLAKLGKAQDGAPSASVPSAQNERPTVEELDQFEATRHIPKEVLDRIPTEDLVDLLHKQSKSPKTVPEVIFDKQIIVPGMVFGSFAAVAFFIAYFSYKKRRELFLLIQETVKSGHPLPHTFVESLESKKKPTADSDLRKAVILIALGLSSIVIIGTVADAAEKGAAAIGVLPLLLGIAYLLLWKWSKPKDVLDSKQSD